MTAREQILRECRLFSLGTDGIGGWLSKDTDDKVFERLDNIGNEHLTKVQLNQLLAFGHEAPASDDFYVYYWLKEPDGHPYDVSKLPDFKQDWIQSSAIQSLEHLKWGLYRLFVDGLLYFGDVRTAYRKLRTMTKTELKSFFSSQRFDTDVIKSRGPALDLLSIPQDDRYLISEMACKSYGDQSGTPGELQQALVQAYQSHPRKGTGRILIKELLKLDFFKGQGNQYSDRQQEFEFSAQDVLEDSVESIEDIKEKCQRIADRYFKVREAALTNTEYYLSMVHDLDVYVATSMRRREDFRKMASTCHQIFHDDRVKGLELRYFDPTLSAAAGHEDKGLIECLMVKCAKALVYCAGDRDSYGKDAEAAMALSLGKPVIFYCDHEQRSRFYRDIHPLSRLIEFETGVAVGAMVTDSAKDVSELLGRIFENRMEYELEHDERRPGYLRLKEVLTGSVIRLQTNDRLLRETFWNHYHNREEGPR